MCRRKLYYLPRVTHYDVHFFNKLYQHMRSLFGEEGHDVALSLGCRFLRLRPLTA